MKYKETRIEIRERKEVRDAINRCRNLMALIGQYEEKAVNYKRHADLAVENCKNVVNIECENFSGYYYEYRYIPYRNYFFENIQTISDGAEEMLGEIRDRIDLLNSKIGELMNDLYEEVEVEYWVESDMVG